MQRIYEHATWFVISGLIIAAGYELYTRSWSDLFVVAQAVALCVVPFVLHRKYGIYTPPLIRLGVVLFLFSTLFLGEVNQFYTQYYWWDALLHAFSGVGVTLIAFVFLVIIYNESELRSTPFITTLLAFSVSMMLAVLWEVYEFLFDTFGKPDMPMQPSNFDTMSDFIAAIFGSLVVSVPGYRYLLHRNNHNFVSEVITDSKIHNT